jgi:Fe-S cluster assembly iron-binding protein IscA
MNKGDIKINTTKIQVVIRDYYYKLLYTNEVDYLKEMIDFWKIISYQDWIMKK